MRQETYHCLTKRRGFPISLVQTREVSHRKLLRSNGWFTLDEVSATYSGGKVVGRSVNPICVVVLGFLLNEGREDGNGCTKVDVSPEKTGLR